MEISDKAKNLVPFVQDATEDHAAKLIERFRRQAKAEALREAADYCWGHIDTVIPDAEIDDYRRGYGDAVNRLALKYRAQADELERE